MSRRGVRLALLVCLLIAATAAFLTSRARHRRAAGTLPSAPAATGENAPPRPAGREAPAADPEWLAAAADRMRGPRQASCGPFLLLTDAPPQPFDALCSLLAEATEREYGTRIGVQPLGAPRGAVILFARRSDFRAFVAERTRLPLGYAGFSRPSRSLVVVAATDDVAAFSSTLAHELAHLLHRRAFGSSLPPWLTEGLADAIADGAGLHGLAPLSDLSALAPLRRRLLGARDAGVMRSIGDLITLDRSRFDRGTVSYDYEQSALVVRFLLLDRSLAKRFREMLADLASGTPFDPATFEAFVTNGAMNLDARFAAWLESWE